jgi:uncharacterized coiled-coil DUF342 family protein
MRPARGCISAFLSKTTKKEGRKMYEKITAWFEKIGPMARAYLPVGCKELLQEMAVEIDRLRAEVNEMKGK